MNTKRLILSWPRALRDNVALLVVLTSLLIGATVVRWLGGTYAQLLMTVLVLGVGGLLTRRNLDTMHYFPVVARINLATTVVWEACSFLLIWTDLRSELLLWRISWVALIAVLGLTHLLALRIAAADQSGVVNRLARGSVAVLTLMLLYHAATAPFPFSPSRRSTCWQCPRACSCCYWSC